MSWISVKDKLPSFSGNYLTYNGEYLLIRRFVRNEKQWNGSTQRNEYFSGFSNHCANKYVTHWQPLPDLPKDIL